MVHADTVKEQMKRMGVTSMFWFRDEIKELPKILVEGEQLRHMVGGRYEGGFALFCATNFRVLLIDKKPFYLTLEDVRFDMISDVLFNYRLLDANVKLGTVHKTITFTGYNQGKLRALTSYVQEQVMAFRQQQNGYQQPQTAAPVSVLAPAGSAPEALVMPAQPRPNPYKMPVMIRHRVSRFY